jgi:RND superfamily putative drug exporter
MFERLGRFDFRFRYAIILAWAALAVGALAFAPSLAQVGSTDQSTFLPARAESVRARDLVAHAFPGEDSAGVATIAFSRASGLTAADRAYVTETAAWLTGPEAPSALRSVVKNVATADAHPELEAMLRSQDGALELVNVNLRVAGYQNGAHEAVAALRDHLGATAPAGLEANVTGSVGISNDYMDAILRGTDSTTVVTVLLVVVILLLIYRAPLAALVPLITIGAAFLAARGVLGELAQAGWRISSLLDTFVVVLVFGVGTDYTIFLISRFREELGRGDWAAASQATVKRIGAVISASAATVIVGLGSMAVADFGMIQTTGPALAITIFVTLLAGLTLAPALLAVFGHYLFWPLHERDQSGVDTRSLFARLAAGVSRRPALVTAVLLAALLIPTAALPSMRSNFDVLAELPADSDARAGFEQVAAHLGKGRIMPATALVDAPAGTDLLSPSSLAWLRKTSAALASVPGVQGVTSLIEPTGDATVPDGYRPSAQLGAMAKGFSGGGGGAEALLKPDVSEGLASALAYVKALAPAFPDVAGGAGYVQTVRDLEEAPALIARLRDGARVSNQLRALAAAATQPTGRDPAAGLRALAGYLGELATAYPDAAALPAFADARGALLALSQQPDVATVLRLSTALSSLAQAFDSRPDAVLFPTSLPATPAATALQDGIATTFGRIPTDLQGLAGTFGARPDDLFIPASLPGPNQASVQRAIAGFLSTGHDITRLYVVATSDPYSTPAFATVRDVRGALATEVGGLGAGASGWVGGPTAELSDIQDALGSDFQRVAIITILGVLLVLVLLLRAIVAPVFLVLTVLLSYLATLGIATVLYQDVLGHPGVNYYLPLMVFVLLVALGSDYNIFLMSRVREESEHRPIRDGIRVASGRTGAVITSAGIILAGTFGSMATAPLVVLFQVGVAVAVGVLLDTVVVRSILVPAITTLAGNRAWWPSARGRAAGELPPEPTAQPPSPDAQGERPAPPDAVPGALAPQ